MGWADAPEVPDWQKAPEVKPYDMKSSGVTGSDISTDSLSNKALRAAHDITRSVGLAGRTIMNAPMALPLAAMDAGVGSRNLLTGSNYDSATKMWEDSQDQAGVLKPQTTGEKVSDFIGQMLIGSKLPAPEINNPAPPGFGAVQIPPALMTSQKAGYVVPPSTTNPTVINKILESFGGKIATAQDAASKNADISNTLAKRAIGLSEDAPLTEGAIDAVRKEAGAAYKAVSNLGELDATGASLPKDVVTNTLRSPLLQGEKKTVDAGELVRAWKQVNSDSSAYYKAYARDANPETLAKASSAKGAASKIANFLDEKLTETGNTELLDQLKSARQLIAKTYSVEKAFNPATGNVNATKLAQQLTKGAPLSGELKIAAQFGQAFPKAAQAITDSGSVRNTDVLAGAGAAALDHDPKWLLYPFARMAARKLMLSPMGQKLAVPSAPANLTGTANATAQAISNALRQ